MRVHLNYVHDESCASDDNHCTPNLCRLCKFRNDVDPDYEYFVACSSIIQATGPQREPDLQASNPTSALDEPSDDDSYSCEAQSESYLSDGVKFVYDESCTSDASDCYFECCHFCKLRDDVDPQYSIYNYCSFVGQAALPSPMQVSVKMAATDSSSLAPMAPFEYAVAGAAAVGVVAVAVMVVLGVKRAVNRLHSTSGVQDIEA